MAGWTLYSNTKFTCVPGTVFIAVHVYFSLKPGNNLMREELLFHFTDEEMGLERVSNLVNGAIIFAQV